MISGLSGENYEEKCKELNIDTLKKREVYKTINKTGALDPASLFKHPEVRPGVSTRSGSNPDRLLIPNSKLEIRRNFFTVRVIEKSNALPQDLKSMKNLQQFKHGLNTLLGQRWTALRDPGGYTTTSGPTSCPQRLPNAAWCGAGVLESSIYQVSRFKARTCHYKIKVALEELFSSVSDPNGSGFFCRSGFGLGNKVPSGSGQKNPDPKHCFLIH